MGFCFSKEKDNMPVVGSFLIGLGYISLWYDILIMISIVPIANFRDAKVNENYGTGHSSYIK